MHFSKEESSLVQACKIYNIARKSTNRLFKKHVSLDEELSFVWKAYCLLRNSTNEKRITSQSVINYIQYFGYTGANTAHEFIDLILDLDEHYLERFSECQQ